MPLRLTDDQLEILRRAAEPLAPEDRDKFFQIAAERLRGFTELGNGLIFRVARDAQGELLRPPEIRPGRPGATTGYQSRK